MLPEVHAKVKFDWTLNCQPKVKASSFFGIPARYNQQPYYI